MPPQKPDGSAVANTGQTPQRQLDDQGVKAPATIG